MKGALIIRRVIDYNVQWRLALGPQFDSGVDYVELRTTPCWNCTISVGGIVRLPEGWSAS